MNCKEHLTDTENKIVSTDSPTNNQPVISPQVPVVPTVVPTVVPIVVPMPEKPTVVNDQPILVEQPKIIKPENNFINIWFTIFSVAISILLLGSSFMCVRNMSRSK
jgi:hypothetical protein